MHLDRYRVAKNLYPVGKSFTDEDSLEQRLSRDIQQSIARRKALQGLLKSAKSGNEKKKRDAMNKLSHMLPRHLKKLLFSEIPAAGLVTPMRRMIARLVVCLIFAVSKQIRVPYDQGVGAIRFQEKLKGEDRPDYHAQDDVKVEGHRPDDHAQDDDLIIFGQYNRTVKDHIVSRLKLRQKQIEKYIAAKDSDEEVREICTEFERAKNMLQSLDPQLKFCFFEDWTPDHFVSFLSIVQRLISTIFFYAVIICKPFIQQYLWVVITAIYIPAMYQFDSIGDNYVLINPRDAAAHPRFDFGPTVYSCPSAPPGHPILLNYSYQIVSGWYDVLVYAFTIGFTIRQLGLAQMPIYDWITVDELMDDSCETAEDEQLFSFREHKMSWFECMDVLIDRYFDAILRGQKEQSKTKSAANPSESAGGTNYAANGAPAGQHAQQHHPSVGDVDSDLVFLHRRESASPV
jgi:hypothetical protein